MEKKNEKKTVKKPTVKKTAPKKTVKKPVIKKEVKTSNIKKEVSKTINEKKKIVKEPLTVKTNKKMKAFDPKNSTKKKSAFKEKIEKLFKNVSVEQIVTGGIAIIIILLVIIVLVSVKKPTVKAGNDTIVTVAGKKITTDQLYNKLSEAFGRDVLIEMIDEIILNKAHSTTKDMTAAVDRQIEEFKSTYGDQFISFLEYNGIFGGEKELTKVLLKNEKTMLVVEKYIKDNLTEKEMKKYYEEKIYGDIKASHILLSFDTKEESSEEEKTADDAAKLAIANEVIEKLNGGANFAELAKEYSKDTSNAEKGGDLGFFNIGSMEEPFEKAAFDLKVNKYTKEPVKTTYGYHIILKTEEKKKPSYKDAKSIIIDKLVTEYQTNDSTIMAKALESIRKKYKLKIYDKDIEKDYNSFMKELKTKRD